MTKIKKESITLYTLIGLLFYPTISSAEIVPYQHIGNYNSTSYTFTAKSSGDLTGYFAGGSGAGYQNAIGVLVNGTQLGSFALGNHSTSLGASYNFGHVNAGDNLIFVLRCYTLGLDAYSDPKMNALYDNLGDITEHNHIYSQYHKYSSDAADIPTGMYVGFEDLRSPHSDYNYNDQSVVFTNVSYTTSLPISSPVPEPATWAMMLLGFAGLTYTATLRREGSDCTAAL